ncbi:MAG: hypothetical protein EAX95_07640 [Candidatus Thorarchaeota archaeon]|nr:hypothetical protein [Candidatus Thorarchaeota archaeon]
MTSGRQTISVILAAFGIYIFWMSTAAVYLHGDAVTGVFWSSSPPGSLFPIPYGPGPLMMLTLANPIDSFLYLLLFRFGIWIILEILVILYVVLPYTLARSVVDEDSRRSSD